MKDFPAQSSADTRFRRRALLFGGVTVVLLAGILGATAVFAVVRRPEYLAIGRRIATQEGRIQPPRGRILDADGIPVAWSERYFDLMLASDLPLDTTPDAICAALSSTVSNIDPGPVDSDGTLLRSSLTPREVIALKPMLRKFRCIKIRQRTERMVASDENVRRAIGEVARHHGISGLEKRHDRVLAGTPGEYEVLLDRHRDWVEGSLKLKKAPVRGKDVTLDVSISVLARGDAEKKP